MSRTLFWYILKDLLRVFLLTSGGLAGIMSFGGLLRPLTEHGLDAGQVAKMLGYFMPAMMTYSLPIAALFATTVVYGRVAADNEVTACRAAGISYLSIAAPAMVLGLTVALISLLFLCFIVPVFTLRVQGVIYENLAQLVAGEIKRDNQIEFRDQTIYAREAAVAPVDPARPDQQVVTLGDVMVVSQTEVDDLSVPREFYLARAATATIWPDERNNGYLVQVQLEGGNTVPRTYAGAFQGGLSATSVGPFPIRSPIREKTDFMDVAQLHELYQNPTHSRAVQEVMSQLVSREQSATFLQRIAADLTGRTARARLDGGSVVYELRRGPEPPRLEGEDLVIPGPAELVEEQDGRIIQSAQAGEIRLAATPVNDAEMAVTLRLRDSIRTLGDEQIPQSNYIITPTVAMPQAIRELGDVPPETLLASTALGETDRNALRRVLIRLSNGIHAELHGRASFAVSCLILVIVGCALGLMFKSGNFLSAFALSVAPALMCIALIVTGQHMAESVPWNLTNFTNSQLNIGLTLIWSGNVVVLALALVLMGRLQRQ